MRLLIIGTGYVGLVTGACFAEMGHHVICLDTDENKISGLKRGELPFFEPGLSEIVLRNSSSGRLSFTTEYKSAIQESDLLFIAVSTPSTEDGSCDLTYVLSAAREIGRHMNGYKIVINKSTVPVGSTKQVTEAIKAVSTHPFDVVSNPEFLKEGSAIADCMKPDRIVLGVSGEKAESVMKELYSSFTFRQDRILVMDPASAEMTKYAANAMLACRISFMNELAGLCEKLGANIHNVRTGIGTDQRIGPLFLYSGIGYGGSCFPKDIRALQKMATLTDYEMPILSSVEKINERQKQLLGEKIKAYFATQDGVKGKTIALWGLSFKPETDDLREAPSLNLINELYAQGAHLRLYDPIATKKMEKLFPQNERLIYCADEYEAAKECHAIALVTEWKQFRFVDTKQILTTMQGKAFFDGRNQYKPQEMRETGF